MSDVEERAISVVAAAVSDTPLQRAMAAAITRIAGNALAKLTNHEEAWRLHSECARRHFQRIHRGSR